MPFRRAPRPARVVSAWSLAGCLALTLAAAGSAPASARQAIAPPAGLASADAARLPPPRHQGTLRVTGALRDGGTVRATGLSWRPGALPPGDRLLSFEVGYYWSACTAADQ